MVDGTGIIGVDMVCPLGDLVSPPQPPNYDKIEMEGVGSLVLPNSLKAPLERLELLGNSVQLTTTGKNLLNIPFIDGSVRETPIQCNFEKPILIHAETLPKSIQSNVWRIKAVYKDNTLKYVVDSDMQKGSLFDASPENPIVSINYRGLYITEGQYEKIQVEHGVKVTPYEPYTGLKPSPSPEYPQEIKSAGKWNEGTQKYEVDVKVTGKNLLDIKDITSETPQWLEIPCLIKNNIYIKSNNSTVLVENNQARLIVCFKDGTSRAMYDNSMTNGLPFKANSENPITTIKVRGTHIKSGVYSGIQVEYGNEPTPYEPYTEQSVQIALDEPLRGIGEYKDVLTKDGVVRKIKRTVFDGSEDEKWALSNDPKNITTNRFCIGMKTINTYYKMLTMCNKMAWKNANQVDVVGQSTHGVNFYITLPKDLAPDLQTFRTWLSQNPLTVDYVLAEPVTELLPESVQAQLQALHSENGTTHVFVDSGEVPCGIKLTYRKEK